MRILVLDTALGACQAALAEIEAGQARLVAAECEAMARGHAEALMPMLARILRQAGPEPAECVAATVGPGSFTGLRVAVSAARALALAWGVPACGVTSLAAMAAGPARASGRQTLALIDARRDEAYWQCFSPEGRASGEPSIATYGEIAATIAGQADVTGSGAEKLAALDPARFRTLDRPAWPDMAEAALLAVSAEPARPARPLYVRPPDAKLPPATAGLVTA